MKVGESLDRLKTDGWYLVATRGSHRPFKHPVKSGRVTVQGKPSDDLAQGTLNNILTGHNGRTDPMRYAIVFVFEKAGSNYSAYVPDLPGGVATGATVEETEREIREARSGRRSSAISRGWAKA